MKVFISLCFLFTISLTSAQEIEAKSSIDPDAYTIVDKPASFPDGHKSLHKFLKSEMNYPELALENGVEGRVFVQLIVEENGELTSLQVVKGIGSGCDEEALRVIAKSSPWNPGQIDGKPVRQILFQYMLFELEDGTKGN